MSNRRNILRFSLVRILLTSFKDNCRRSKKRCKSLWKNIEPHSSTILEYEKLNIFLLERATTNTTKNHI